LIKLPARRQTPAILSQFLRGDHNLIFYLKSSPAAKWFLRSRSLRTKKTPVIGTIESQCDLRNEPTVAPEAMHLWEQTVLRCDYLFANSCSVQRSLKSEYGLASEIVPTGVDTNFFSPDPGRPANPRPRVLFVGSMRPFKGPQLVLDVAVRFPCADFVLVGEGILGAELRSRAAREHLANVHFAGSIPIDDVRKEYRRSDIFFFPSTWEGSPKVILEAAACALPVVASSRYEPDTVIHGQTGYLAVQSEEFFPYLEMLLAKPGLRRDMGRAGRILAEKFDWDVVTRRWQEFFVLIAGLASHDGNRMAVAASL
jgi:glycosyltransferase involved in cell wall biosynthesis